MDKRKPLDTPSERDSAQTDFDPAALQDPTTREVLDETIRQMRSRDRSRSNISRD